MGLFDKFKKKEEPTIAPASPTMQKQSTISINEFLAQDGHTYVEIDFFNEQANFKDFYDSTRLIVRKDPTILASGKTVNEAQVSWYSEHDAVMFGKDGEELCRRNEMSAIKLGIDFDMLRTNGMYQTTLMTELLNKSRVESYLVRGMQDNPEQPCGNYVGQVGIVQDRQTGKSYWGKQFDVSMGREIHYSPEQMVARQMQKQEQDKARQAMIEEKQRKIAELQSEIDDLDK